jgi:hypothetical protein
MKTRRSLVTAMLLSGLLMLARDTATAQAGSPVPTATAEVRLKKWLDISSSELPAGNSSRLQRT